MVSVIFWQSLGTVCAYSDPNTVPSLPSAQPATTCPETFEFQTTSNLKCFCLQQLIRHGSPLASLVFKKLEYFLVKLEGFAIVNVATLPKCSRSLSFEHAVLLTPLANTFSIDRKSFSCLVKAGFIVVMPFHHGYLELY